MSKNWSDKLTDAEIRLLQIAQKDFKDLSLRQIATVFFPDKVKEAA